MRFWEFSKRLLKGVCHEIFDPIWAPDNQAKVFSNSVLISPRNFITK